MSQPVITNAAEANLDLRHSALKDMIAAGLLTGAVGIGARALNGSSYLFGDSRGPSDRLPLPNQVMVPKPVFVSEADAERERKKRQAEEMAAMEMPGAPKVAFLGDVMAGRKATTKGQIPWYYGGMALASLLGGVGGYNLADRLADAKRKKDLKDEVEASKAQFQQALLSNYDPATVGVEKAAGEDDLYQVLDKLADAVGVTDEMNVKEAISLGEILGQTFNSYGAVAIPLTVLSAAAAYKANRSRSEEHLIGEATKRRQRELAARRPLEIQVLPEPVTIRKGQVIRDDSEPELAPRSV